MFDSKSNVPQGTGGSNPSLSAKSFSGMLNDVLPCGFRFFIVFSQVNIVLIAPKNFLDT